MVRLLLCVATLALSLDSASAADASTTHPHRGIAKPFKAGDPGIKLTGGELAQLAKGATVKRQVVDRDTGSGTAFAVQDVAAPVTVVLDRIKDFAAYPQMVSGVVECGNYRETTHRNGTQSLLTKMTIKAAIMKLTGFFHHTYYPPPLSSVTWTLDYDRASDYVDSAGYWYVGPHPDRPETDSRVFYSVNLMPAEWVPDWIVDIIQKQALVQATAWVKFESEKRAKLLFMPATGKVTGAPGPMRRGQKRSLKCIWLKMRGKNAAEPACLENKYTAATDTAGSEEAPWYRSAAFTLTFQIACAIVFVVLMSVEWWR